MKDFLYEAVIQKVQADLLRIQDVRYRDFLSKLIPTVAPEMIIGVRTPELRAYAKELSMSAVETGDDAAKELSMSAVETGDDVAKELSMSAAQSSAGRSAKQVDRTERSDGSMSDFDDSAAAAFIENLPHEYFDEDQLHAFIISEIKDYDKCMEEVERFLPYINNWATCDQMSPKVFRSHKQELIVKIREWLAPYTGMASIADSGAGISESADGTGNSASASAGMDASGSSPVKVPAKDTYTVRFAVGMLMQHFLDEDFDPEYLGMVSRIRSDEYYVNMMTAWYFATALAKQYDAAVPYIEDQSLDVWTHNKAIRKAIESRRITPEQKDYLRSLKR